MEREKNEFIKNTPHRNHRIWLRSRISREERAGEGRCGGCASFEEAAAGKAMCHLIYLFITIDRL